MDLDTALTFTPDDEPRARAALQALWDEAQQRGDATAAWQAAAAALVGINLHYCDFRGASRWCERFAAGLPAARAAGMATQARAADAVALRGCAAVLAWTMLDHAVLAQPGADALLPEAAQALSEGLRVETGLPPTQRFMLAKCLLDYLGQQMDPVAATPLMAMQQEKLHATTPALQAHWWFVAMAHHEYHGQAEPAAQARVRLTSLLDSHEVPGLRFALATIDMPTALKTGQLARADRLHRELEALMPDMPAGSWPHGLRAQALYLSHRGDFGAALMRADCLLAVCRDVEVPERDQGAYHVLRANILAALGRFDEALAELAAQRPYQLGPQGETLEVVIAFAEAAARLDSEPDGARAWLATALAGAVRMQYNRFYLNAPALAARLCALALDAGIETEFVRTTIRDRHLAAPDPSRPDWPWRIRVQVLGELRVWRDELPLSSPGKAQRKPLELLALLAAHGGGPLDADAVIDALWPSLEADAPKASLEMAVSRLRKLLDLPEAVVVADGMVSLDPTLVWCDAGAFETLVQDLLRDLRPPGSEAHDAVLAHRAERLFSLYRDRLLGSETLAGSMSLVRERLAQSFYRSVVAWGSHLETKREWAAAVALYERALTHDVLAEPIYRALMRAHLACGERAEALRTFRRCRELLASVLGTSPAAETLALFREATLPAS
jgi:DNA-binding SARP family transcriptional activator